MQIRLAYGKSGLLLELPDDACIEVIENRFVAALANPVAALRDALRAPLQARSLRELAGPQDSVAIVFSDITRPTPNHILLPAVLEQLAPVPAHNILLCNALGTHRPNTRSELAQLLGDDLVDRYRIVQTTRSTRTHSSASGAPPSGTSCGLAASICRPTSKY